MTFCEQKLYIFIILHLLKYAYKHKAMDDKSNDGSSFYRLSNRLLLFATMYIHGHTVGILWDSLDILMDSLGFFGVLWNSFGFFWILCIHWVKLLQSVSVSLGFC